MHNGTVNPPKWNGTSKECGDVMDAAATGGVAQ